MPTVGRRSRLLTETSSPRSRGSTATSSSTTPARCGPSASTQHRTKQPSCHTRPRSASTRSTSWSRSPATSRRPTSRLVLPAHPSSRASGTWYAACCATASRRTHSAAPLGILGYELPAPRGTTSTACSFAQPCSASPAALRKYSNARCESPASRQCRASAAPRLAPLGGRSLEEARHLRVAFAPREPAATGRTRHRGSARA